jgi:hypothetical protein
LSGCRAFKNSSSHFVSDLCPPIAPSPAWKVQSRSKNCLPLFFITRLNTRFFLPTHAKAMVGFLAGHIKERVQEDPVHWKTTVNNNLNISNYLAASFNLLLIVFPLI